MKKLLFTLILLIFLSFPMYAKAIATNSLYDANIYLFYEDDCKECDDAKDWLQEYLKDKNLVRLDYINIDENKELLSKVKESLNTRKDKLPLILIGTNYFIGFSDNDKNNITNAISSYQNSDSYCDIVYKIRNDEDIKECINQNNGIYNIKTKNTKLYIIISILLVVIISAVIYIIKRKK